MVEQPFSNRTDADATACAIPSDLDSVVDRLMSLVGPEAGDEIDRAVNRRAQMTLVRTIRSVIENDEADKAA
ncbi:hypothetical protein GTW25_12440 [Aliihoeflea aestuarii]|uniref:hypothetical protein n=1 Tax=Aliihoeflea aestuarii TaxID=453840 RepID=UPI0020930F85|nr:hypothetical protein [Aliihoeflea aestuarii]MCO6391839.1 hypothetical protein [Aliihoeflea aestuarii]